MQVEHQIPARGPTRNDLLPKREGDPWEKHPQIQKLMQRAQIPESVAKPLAKYIQLSALVEWGAIGYEPGSLERAARDLGSHPIAPSIGVNLRCLGALLSCGEDLLIRTLEGPDGRAIVLVGLDGLMDTDRIEKHVIRSLYRAAEDDPPQGSPPPGMAQPVMNIDLFDWLQAKGITAASMQLVETIAKGVASILQGDLLILVDGFPKAAFVSLRGWVERAIDESKTEPGMRAPKESFNESLRTMTALVRRRIHSPHLRIERYLVGVQSPTPVDLMYIQGIISPDLVHEIRARLGRVQVEGLHSAGNLEEFLEDQPSAFFPQFMTTERPDRVAAALLEGQFAVLVDGFQNAKVAPVSFTHFMTSPDDYEERFWYSSFILWIRFLFLILVTVVPSFFVSVMSVHPDLLPTRILISLAAARQGIPYPTVIEVFLMEIFFEGMREATALMPRTVGSAVTVVGGLVLGEGAIASGLASPATVVIVALTGIASFTIPVFSLTTGLRIIRFALLIVSAVFGLYGLMLGLLLILLHLCALRSFGRPYLEPLAPFSAKEISDSLIRAPYWKLTERPAGNRPLNPRRKAPWLRPSPKQ